MAKIDYTINVHSEYDSQTITITGEVPNAVVDEANMDAAVRSFASSLAAGNTSYPLTLDAVHKITTSSTDVLL